MVNSKFKQVIEIVNSVDCTIKLNTELQYMTSKKNSTIRLRKQELNESASIATTTAKIKKYI